MIGLVSRRIFIKYIYIIYIYLMKKKIKINKYRVSAIRAVTSLYTESNVIMR